MAESKAESKPSSALGDKNDPPGEMVYRRKRAPSNYSFKVHSFTKLLETKVEEYESGPFHAGDYKWRIIFYPNGNKQRKVEDGYISLYIKFDLSCEEAKVLPRGWEITADMKLFAFDWIKKSYRVIHGVEVSINETHPEWGFEHLLTREEFEHQHMGYLDKDCCIFGAEIIIMHITPQHETPQHETLSIVGVKQPAIRFEIQNFKKFSEKGHGFSPQVPVGGRKWQIEVYPNGNGDEAKGNWLSAFLVLCDADTLLPKGKIYAKYKLRVVNQRGEDHVEHSAANWFTAKSDAWGQQMLLRRGDLYQENKGYVLKDTLIIEAEITEVSEVKRTFHE